MSIGRTSRRRLLPGFVALLGCAFGFGVFGWLGFRIVLHEVFWREPASVWQFVLPGLLGAGVWWAARSRLGVSRTARFLSMLAPIWPVGIGGVVLGALQWRLDPGQPWLLYAWILLLVWAARRVARHVRVGELSGRTAWGLIVAATLAMTALHVSMQYEQWSQLSFGYRDIGLFARALHSAAEGDGLWVDSLGRSLLGEHAFFGLYALTPLCRLGAEPFDLLVVLSAVSLDGSALIVAWFVRRRLRSNLAAAVAALAWLMLPFHGLLILAAKGYGFHAVYPAVPFLLAGLFLGAERRWFRAVLCMLIAMSFREDIALTVIAWSAYVFIADRKRVLGIAVFVAAIMYLWCAIFVVVPHYRGMPYPHVANHFQTALQALGQVSSYRMNVSLLLGILLPFGLVPLKKPWVAAMAVPVLVETLLLENPRLHSLSFHYYTPAVPILVFAAVRAWEECGRRRAGANSGDAERTQRAGGGSRAMRAGWLWLSAAVIGQVYLGIGPLGNSPLHGRSSEDLASSLEGIEQVRMRVPRGASVTASYRVAAHFLDYDRLWTCRNGDLGDLVIVDDRDTLDEAAPRETLIRALRTGAYQPIWADYHLVAVYRTETPTELAKTLVPESAPAFARASPIDMGLGIGFVGMDVRPEGTSTADGRCYTVSVVWVCLAPVEEDLRFGLRVGEDGVRYGPFPFARGAYPPSAWVPGRTYRDDVKIVLREQDIPCLADLRLVLLR